jgi:hypothetical protein
MNLKTIFLLGLLTIGSFRLNAQTFNTLSLSGGMGIPVGKTNYPENNFPDAALFSNFGHTIHLGLDITSRSSKRWEYGLFTRWNKYLSWQTNGFSDRFSHSSLSTLDIGPLFIVNISSISNLKRHNKILLTPFLSFTKLKNHNSSFNLRVEEPSNISLSQPLLFQKNEPITKLTQILPGIYVAYEWSKYLSENSLFFVRPGFSLMLTKTDGYPDKYALAPSLTIGYTFDRSRNKWFYIKNLK